MNRAGRAAVRLVALLGVVLLGACNAAERLAQVGREPRLDPIQNPTQRAGYQPVSLPMPEPETNQPAGANSLWRSGSRAFFADQRARRLGDVLTVKVTIADRASLSNETKRSRKNNEDLGVENLLGLQSRLTEILPPPIDPGRLVTTESQTSNTGRGSVARNERVQFDVAAVVTQILPNGNLVIEGRQQIRVNFEVRELFVQGVVRPEDVDSRNSISHDKIAELRMSYGGRGQITDVQQPRYGSQILDILLPF